MDRVMIFLAAVILASVQESGAGGDLEINYDPLSAAFYHRNYSNVVYGSMHRLVLGCMLPPSTSLSVEDNERHNLMWGKDQEEAICSKINTRVDACRWEDRPLYRSQMDTDRSRGMKLLSIILTETGDNFEQGFAGTGIYRCYHEKKDYNEAEVKVFVAGNLLEIMVDGTKMDGQIYQLPEKTVSEIDRKDLELKCDTKAGAKGLVDGKTIIWYRNENPVSASDRFVFGDDLHKTLAIKKAASSDSGVYMCEADIYQQSEKPITSLQYVVLQGDPFSGASSIFHRCHNHLLLYACIALLVRIIACESTF